MRLKFSRRGTTLLDLDLRDVGGVPFSDGNPPGCPSAFYCCIDNHLGKMLQRNEAESVTQTVRFLVQRIRYPVLGGGCGATRLYIPPMHTSPWGCANIRLADTLLASRSLHVAPERDEDTARQRFA